MSSGLMSCVRENSPPIDNGVEETSGPFSLPVSHSTSFSPTPNCRQSDMHFNDTVSSLAENNLPVEVDVSNAEAKATPNTDNKRRRFQPFRNLRRLFRRRTISSSVHDKPRPTEHDKDYNDRRGSSSATARVVRDIARDKFKISTENREQEQLKFENSYSAQTLPKNSCCDTLNPINRSLIKIWESANNPLSSDACNRCQKLSELKSEEDVMYATTSRAGSQTLPVSFVMYNNSNNYAMNAEKLSTTKRDSLNDFKRKSSQESESDSKTSAKPLSSSSNDGVDITDNQYTMSEDRLLNSACSQEPLSQSHDSVFSESATASSFSSVLKAELADVLRKRRNRPDASDEDLGLPRSPTSPRRLNDAQALQTHTLANLQSNTESCDDLFCTSTANNSFATQYETAPVEERISSRNCHRLAQINVAASNNKRHTISSSAFQEIADELDAPRLSHDGAKHKIALRQKKKAPTRLQRRTLDMSIPEMNENFVKIPATRAFFEDSKLKTTNMEHTFPPLTNSHGSTNLAQFYRKRNRDQLNAPFIENTQLPAYSIRTMTTKSEQRAQAARPELSVSKDNLENVFLRTVALRSSFRSLNKDEDEFDSQAKKLHISSTNYDVKEELKQHTPKKSSDFLMNMQLLNSESKPALSTPTKAKSGPEARQRYAPISLNFPEPDNSATLSNCQHVIRAQKEKEKLKSTAMIKHIVSVQQSVREVNDLDFELSPRTVNMQAYKRKPYSACEKSEEEEEATLRKPVEKSRSFKLAGNVANNNNNNKNMPSLPDLSGKESENRYFVKTSPTQDKSVSLGFEINDNNLMRRSVPVATKCQLKITPQTSKSAMDLSNSKVLLPQNGGSSSSNRDINEIEQNIDMIVKSTPYISIVERRVEPNSSKSSEDLTRASKTNRPNRLSLKMEPSESLLNLMPIPIKEKKTQEEKPLMNVFKIEVEKNKTKNKENLPEFLKIQLTPIDSAEKASEHVVLAKNVRSTSMKEASPSPSASSNGTTTTSINSDSRDGSISPISKRFLELKRHDSNESIEIKEKSVPPKKLVEAVNGDARALVNNFLARNSLKSNTELPKETRNPVNPIKPGVHNLRSFSLQERRRIFLQDEPSKTVTVGDLSKPAAVVKKAEEMTTPTTPNTPNTPKTPNTPTTPTTPNTPTVKSKVEVLKSVVAKTKERQVTKSVAKTTTVSGLANNESTTGFTTETKPRMPKPATTESKPIATTTPTPTTPTTPSETPAVVLRKKPAASSLPITGKLQLASSPRKMSSRNDEPELMKVFARRSLKVKDEDVNNLNEKIQAHNYASSRRTICGMDSDKENQSASIERLNKLMQFAADREENEDKETNNNNNNNNNDNDIIIAKNSNNNNNGINISTPLSPTKVITPTHENNKLNNNNASNSFAKPKVDNVDLSNGNAVQNDFIAPRGKSQAMQERTATMGEFKNINQRRAEWEQRAKGVKN